MIFRYFYSKVNVNLSLKGVTVEQQNNLENLGNVPNAVADGSKGNIVIKEIPATADLPFTVEKDEKIVYYAKPDKDIYVHNLTSSVKYVVGIALLVVVVLIVGFLLFINPVIGLDNAIIYSVIVIIVALLIEFLATYFAKKSALFGYQYQNYWITTKRLIRQVGITTVVSQALDVMPLDTVSEVEIRDLHLSKMFQEGWTVIAHPIAFTGYMSSSGQAYGGQSLIRAFPHMTKEQAEEFKKYLVYERDLNNPNLVKS